MVETLASGAVVAAGGDDEHGTGRRRGLRGAQALDGLVHISEVAHKRVNDIADELTVGQTVDAKILDIDTERKRISLSIKQTLDVPAEEAEDDYPEEDEE